MKDLAGVIAAPQTLHDVAGFTALSYLTFSLW
jgi:hypothetical protein